MSRRCGAAGPKNGADEHRTGAIYAEPRQSFSVQKALPIGQWNRYEIRVRDQTCTGTGLPADVEPT